MEAALAAPAGSMEEFEALAAIRAALLKGDVKPVQAMAPSWRTHLVRYAGEDHRLVRLADELVRHVYADRIEGIRDLLDRLAAALSAHETACDGTTHCDLSRRAA